MSCHRTVLAGDEGTTWAYSTVLHSWEICLLSFGMCILKTGVRGWQVPVTLRVVSRLRPSWVLRCPPVSCLTSSCHLGEGWVFCMLLLCLVPLDVTASSSLKAWWRTKWHLPPSWVFKVISVTCLVSSHVLPWNFTVWEHINIPCWGMRTKSCIYTKNWCKTMHCPVIEHP